MSQTKDKLIYDPADVADSDNVGSYLKAGTDGTAISHTGSSLDVNLTNTTIDVNVTNASIAVTGTVTADTNFDYAEDSAHVSGDQGAFMLAVRNDANASLTSTDGDYSPIAVDEFGRLKVTGSFSATTNYEYAEDSAHASGDIGAFILAVRKDTQGPLAGTDGDYSPLQTDDQGRLRVVADIDVSLTGDLQDDDDADTQNALKIAFHAFDTSAGALTAVSADGDKADARSDLYRRMFINAVPNIGVAQEKVTVGTSEVSIFTTPLDGRMQVKIRNVSSNPIWLGPTGVTTSGATEGHKLEKGAILEWDLGRGIDLFAIAGSAGNDIVVTQLA